MIIGGRASCVLMLFLLAISMLPPTPGAWVDSPANFQGAVIEQKVGTFSEAPPMEWNRTHGGAGSDFALALVQTVDGGYALAGRTYSFGAGCSDIWLVKTDAFGNHLWDKTYGGTRDDRTSSLIQTADGGYALAGSTYSFGAGSSDIWLVKTDAFGNHLWNRTYGGTREDDPAHFLVQTGDGGYALAGRTYSFGAGSSDIWLVKTDESGNHLWNRTYGGTNVDGVFAFVQTVDGGYALAGHTNSFGAGNYDYWLVKTDSTGNMVWNRTYGGTNEDWAYALIQTGDGGYAIAGETDSFGAGNGDVWLVRTDAFGNHLWDKTYGGTEEDDVFDSVQTVDGGFALAGHTYSFGAGSCDAWLLKTSADGSHEWNETFGGIAEDFACRLIQTNHEGYALAGSTKSYGAGSDDFWLFRTLRDVTTVTVPDDYSTIQEAINNAIDGDTIFVKTGIYYEHVFVNRTLSLLGEDASTTIVDGSGSGSVFAINKNNITVTSFTIRNSGTTLGNAGMHLDNVSFCSISGNSIRDNFAGIWLEESSENLIVANNITANADDGIVFNYSHNNTISGNHIALHEYFGIVINWSHNNTICYNNVTQTLGPSHGDGINLWRSSHNTIFQNCVEENNRYGIRVEVQSNNNTISHNMIGSCLTGLQLYDSSNFNLIYENNIAECYDGIDVYNSRYTEIFNNTIVHNYGSDEWDAGVRLESAAYTVIRDNEIFDNWRGILLYASSPYVSVHGNNVTSNDYGIRVARGGSSYVNVSDNYVANNRGYGIDVTGFGGGGESNYATIARNLIVNNTFEAVGLGIGSSYNTVIQNNMTRNGHAGVTLERYSNYNTIVQNNIIENAYGICFDLYTVNSTQNTILNNNMINNTQQVRIVPGSVNKWDGGYPSGGNHWSDYAGIDVKRGPYQNEAGSDGIGDTPYVIDGNNRDNYPLMNPWPSGWELDFAAPTNHPIVDFAVYNGTLYAAADNKLYVKSGSSWNTIEAPTLVMSLEPYQDKLVVGGQGGLYCYDGTSFGLVFSVPTYIKVLGTYSNTLHAGTMLDKPPKLYHCIGPPENPANWHEDAGFSAILNYSGAFGSIDSFAVYDGAMYVGSSGKLYSFNGTQWSTAKSYDDACAFLDMQVYDGKLYLATRDQAWRKPLYQGGTGFSGRIVEFDGENWTTVLDHDYWIYSLEVYDKLYAGTANKILTYNGTDWEVSFNATEGAYYAMCFENYDGEIYAGMGNGYIFADPAPTKADPETTVVPEFSSNTILAVLMTLTMLAAALTRKNRSKRFS